MRNYLRATKVINVRGRDRRALLADPGFVYVGRPVRSGWKGTPWGNPFKVGMTWDQARAVLDGVSAQPSVAPLDGTLDIAQVIDCYAIWLNCQPELLARLGELRGKSLGCWCTDWDGAGEPEMICHALVLAKRAGHAMVND